MSQETRQSADKVIDGRSMEPPEPFVQTMEALEHIGPDQKVLLIARHEPFPLYRALDLNGFSWQIEKMSDGSAEVLIWRRENSD